MALIAGIFIMTSCNKDEETFGPPTLNFIGGDGFVDGDANIDAGTEFKVGIAASSNVTSGKKLTSLRLTRTMNNTAFVDTTLTIDENQYNINFLFNAQQAGQSETISFVLTDKAGQTAQKSLTLTYVAAGVVVVKDINVLMGSHNDDNGSFYSTANQMVYNIADATANQASIDFLFYLGVTNGSTIASPADADANTVYAITGWTTKNGTLFNSTQITAAEFDAIGTVYQFPEFSGNLTAVTQLSSGDVIMFKTVGDKLGLIKVNEINGRGDNVSLDILVAE